MVVSMKDSGRMIFNMAQENGLIQMALSLLPFFVSVESMEKPYLHMQMALLIIVFTIMTWKIS